MKALVVLELETQIPTAVKKKSEKSGQTGLYSACRSRGMFLLFPAPLWKQNCLRVSLSLCLVQRNHEGWGGRRENSSASAVGISGVPSLHCRMSPLLFPSRKALGGWHKGNRLCTFPCGAKGRDFGGQKAQIAHETSFHTPPDKAWAAVTDTPETGFDYFNFSLFPFIVPGCHHTVCCAGLWAHNIANLNCLSLTLPCSQGHSENLGVWLSWVLHTTTAFMSIPLALPATPLLSHTEKAGGSVVGAMKDIERKFTGK